MASQFGMTEIYLPGKGVQIKNGCQTRFWLDPWLYKDPLSIVASLLFHLCEYKEVNVDKVKKMVIFVSLLEDGYQRSKSSWDKIWKDVKSFQLKNEPDIVLWKLEKNQKFSVKSMYNALTSNDARIYHKRI